ncbi:MAG: hypothetical protein MUC69_08525 [Gemmatimonadales bacterium]|jgi:hypothetical protein|nr:hypothetical protein [Gemmatimonadales bacterium]
MPAYQARLKPEFRLQYPELNLLAWYDVEQLFPGLTERRVNLFGQRVTRLKVGSGHKEVLNEHLEFRSVRATAG